MNHPDDDLRSAFQHWRRQEAELAPPFPGIPEPSQARHWPRHYLLPASLTAAAALVVLWLALPRTIPPTLADALPRPLLPAASAEAAFLGTPEPRQPSAFASDFLQPRPPFSSSLF